MAVFRPFKAYRPTKEHAAEVAAKPYDVLNSAEAREEVKGHPLSFLHVGKPEIDLDPKIDLHDPQVYQKGKDNLNKLIDDGVLAEDPKEYFYVYAQTMSGRTQYGLVGCASADDYWSDVIKKHEKTRKEKEEDRSEHVRITNAHTGPIFLTYRDNDEVNTIINGIIDTQMENDIVTQDGIRHQTWLIKDENIIKRINEIFKNIDYLYVADGHHRSAAASIVGRERQKANPNHNGDEEYNFFLAVIFPASHLFIMDYNRVVKDLNGLTQEELLNKLSSHFTYEQVDGQYKPSQKGEMGMYINHQWYKVTTDKSLLESSNPVEKLDVAILQKYVLAEILDIQDPRTSNRIDFVGGIRGLGELEKRVDSGEMVLAFSMYPTSIQELMSIADADKIMPPKSTWFEPKLSDGLFVHFLD